MSPRLTITKLPDMWYRWALKKTQWSKQWSVKKYWRAHASFLSSPFDTSISETYLTIIVVFCILFLFVPLLFTTLNIRLTLTEWDWSESVCFWFFFLFSSLSLLKRWARVVKEKRCARRLSHSHRTSTVNVFSINIIIMIWMWSFIIIGRLLRY